ncbi:hypothetical protein C7H09_06160 [Marinobacter fuscus]|uniref:Uncharacterized protein n=1 Tax=Marinobacter fuscus TaxID=2109942 RepID=A0A2T1KK41_9GAMM|nr:hypothetical protein [Marinobacter fuscus]PSF10526.1 hypothetical protein C7H09_06160 [Marinobacter fuscus]
MWFEADNFTEETALEAAIELQKVLAARTHRRKVLGQEVMVPGQLGDALQLPKTIHQLQGKQQRQRERGLDNFRELWPTLSPRTQQRVLDSLGWYNPKELEWDDKRSNRRPMLDSDT